MDILKQIKLNKLVEIKAAKKKAPFGVLKNRALRLKRTVRPFGKALRKKGGISLIAEIKPYSPSSGKLITGDPLKIAKLYAKSRADAISVLTDKKYFHGKIEYLMQVRALAKQPILRKDFILDEYQIYESFIKGADAVLLIAAILSPKKLKGLFNLAGSLGLECLVEVRNLAELKAALEIKAKIIGINNRNLKTLKVYLKTTEKLIKFIPNGKIVVSESGIESVKDVRYLKKLGVSAILVGTAILKSQSPFKKIHELRAA